MAFTNVLTAAGAGLAALVLISAPAAAHEFWISPQSGRVTPGAAIVADLKVGQMLKGEPYPYLSNRFETFAVSVDGDTTEVAGDEGDIPALFQRTDRPGLHVISQQTVAFRVTYDDWAVFRRYLADEGWDSLAAVHRARGLPETGFAERYTRYTKALVQVGPADPSDGDVSVGMPLELVAQANPYAPDVDVLPVRLTWHGAPVAGRRINVFHDGGTVTRTSATTDEAGLARVPLRGEGEYLLNAVVLEPAAEDDAVAWVSHWASLSFKL